MDDKNVDGASELVQLREENAALRRQLDLNRTAHDYLVRLAHHFSGEEASFEGPDQIRAFCERIKHSVGILVREFKELLSGRKRFQVEYGLNPAKSDNAAADGTRMIRLGSLHGDLGQFLFDWKGSTLDSEAFAKLESAIDELKHHQMAFLRGFEHSVREGTVETLKCISPETIEFEVLRSKRGGGFLNKVNPWRSGRLWREYRKRYDELTKEDTGWFQARFLPSFRQGYREYMWARESSLQTADEGAQ